MTNQIFLLISLPKGVKQTIVLFLVAFSTAAFGLGKYANTVTIKTMVNKNQIAGENFSANVQTYLALGDSYTNGEGVKEMERFPVQLTAKLNEMGLNFATPEITAQTGWTTDELLAGIEKATTKDNYDLVTLLIGVNNQYRGKDTAEYRQEFAELLNKSIGFAGGNPQNVVVISIPDYGITPFARNKKPQKISAEIDEFNRINWQEAKKLRTHYVNITGISRLAKDNPELLADDDLHPSGEMYRLWVEAVLSVVRQIIEKK